MRAWFIAAVAIICVALAASDAYAASGWSDWYDDSAVACEREAASCSLADDQNWATYTYATPGASASFLVIYENYTLPSDTDSITTLDYNIKGWGSSDQPVNYTISYYNHSSGAWRSYSDIIGTSSAQNITLSNSSANITGVISTGKPFMARTNFSLAAGKTGQFYEGKARFYVTTDNVLPCGSATTGHPITLTIKMYDEVNTSKPLASTVKAYFDFSGVNNSLAMYGNTTYSLCAKSDSQNLSADINIEYTANGYATRTYYLTDIMLSNVTQTLYLYNINSTFASAITMAIKDSADNVEPDLVLDIQRYYMEENAYKTVDIEESDYSGKVVAYLQPYDTFYRYIIKDQSGTILHTVTAAKITSSTLNIIIPEGELFEWMKYYGNYGGGCTYSNATKVLSCTATSTGIIQSSCIDVKQVGTAYKSICSKCVSGASVAMICDFGGNANGTYVWRLTSNSTADSEYVIVIDSGAITVIGTAISYGMAGLAISFIVVLCCAMIGIWNPVVSVIFTLMSLVAMVYIGFLAMEWGTLMGVAAIGMIVIWRMKQ